MEPVKAKKVMLGVKVEAGVKARLQGAADALGVDLSDHVRAVLAASLAADPTTKVVRAALAEAMVVVLACQGRPVSTEQAVALVKALFVSGQFAEDLR